MQHTLGHALAQAQRELVRADFEPYAVHGDSRKRTKPRLAVGIMKQRTVSTINLLFVILLQGCAGEVSATEEDATSPLTCSMLDGGAILDRGGWELVSCNRPPEYGELSNPRSECEALPDGTYFCRWFFPVPTPPK